MRLARLEQETWNFQAQSTHSLMENQQLLVDPYNPSYNLHLVICMETGAGPVLAVILHGTISGRPLLLNIQVIFSILPQLALPCG